MSLDNVFEALSSTVRRKILAYLSATELTAGEISERFNISKPSISKHLSILENAGLITSERRGQFIHYSLVRDNRSEEHTSELQSQSNLVCRLLLEKKKKNKKILKIINN